MKAGGPNITVVRANARLDSFEAEAGLKLSAFLTF